MKEQTQAKDVAPVILPKLADVGAKHPVREIRCHASVLLGQEHQSGWNLGKKNGTDVLEMCIHPAGVLVRYRLRDNAIKTALIPYGNLQFVGLDVQAGA
jgi:hypothetical protein